MSQLQTTSTRRSWAGGAELIVRYLAEGVAKRGHEVTVVSTCDPSAEPYPEEFANGVRIIRFFPKKSLLEFRSETAGGAGQGTLASARRVERRGLAKACEIYSRLGRRPCCTPT